MNNEKKYENLKIVSTNGKLNWNYTHEEFDKFQEQIKKETPKDTLVIITDFLLSTEIFVTSEEDHTLFMEMSLTNNDDRLSEKELAFLNKLCESISEVFTMKVIFEYYRRKKEDD